MEVLKRIVQGALEALRPPPDLPPSVWAERSVYVPVGNAIPGLINFENAPYQRQPLDMTANPDCRRITLMWGAQVGKTMLMLCGQGYRIAQDATSQMMMQPSQGDLQTWLETKFNPLVDANTSLQSKMAKPRGRDGVNNQLMKSYPGGFIMFSWAGSPRTMRGRSAPFIVCDEVDGYVRTSEGHPVSLLWKRAATFRDRRKLLESSTPTVKGASYIESSFQAGDQRYFHVPCPHCGALQRLVWSRVDWQKDEAGRSLPETAGYVCGECGSKWTDSERVWAIRRAEAHGGGWVAEQPFHGHASYHLSELYSCMTTLGDIVQSFLDAKAVNDLQTFVNTSLAETWEEEGDSVDAAMLIARAEDFPSPVPGGVGVLTAGVDMQEDRLEVEIVGWGLGEESWSVDYRVLWGSPLEPDVWQDLDDLLGEIWTHETGAQLGISAACLDTGGSTTQAAYDYVKKRRSSRLFAIKGVGGWDRPVVSAPSRKRSGYRARKIDLFTVGTDEAKLIVMRRFQQTAEGPGFCHIPKSREAEWFAQATAETLRRRYVKGFPILEWHKTRDRNEALDCRVYAFAALKITQPNIKRALERLISADEEKAPASDPVAPKPSRRRRGVKLPKASAGDEDHSPRKRGRRVAGAKARAKRSG